MASIHRHPRTAFWILRYRDASTGAWKSKSLGLRHDDPADTRKAQRKAMQATQQEQRAFCGKAPAAGPPGRKMDARVQPRENRAFAAWVPGYIESHYRNANSRKRYLAVWLNIHAFLQSQKLTLPADIRYQHGRRFFDWRSEMILRSRGHEYSAGHNTALLELKFFSFLMNEALRREYVTANPLLRLGIGRVAQKAKAELSDADLARLHEAMLRSPRWMLTAFLMALYTGCRFSECEIPMTPDRVDFENDTLVLCDAKRDGADPRKFFRVPLHPRLREHLLTLRGEAITCKLGGDTNGRINRAFAKAGVNATFHCLRVTFITRCHRAGLSAPEAMRLVNHSSHLVHRVYSKLSVSDARLSLAKVALPEL